MDLNFIYREHFMALVAAENAPTARLRSEYRKTADRFWTKIEHARIHGTAAVAA